MGTPVDLITMKTDYRQDAKDAKKAKKIMRFFLALLASWR